MDIGRHHAALILRANLARTLFWAGLLFAYAESSVWAQYDHWDPGYINPGQQVIAATRESLAQDEKNIAVQQMGLAEFESRARTIRRQLEALTLIQ